MKAFIFLAALIAVAVSQYAPQPMDIPIPYSYSYSADTEDGGSSGHQESGDGSGRVTGSYTVNNLEGHSRVVDYIADENGFRATIRTNEPGTASVNPADVTIESSADDGAPAPAVRSIAPVAPPQPAAGGRSGTRYVLVPVTDPRARGYY